MPRMVRERSSSDSDDDNVSRYRIPSHASTEPISSNDTESLSTVRSRQRHRTQLSSDTAEKPKKPLPKRPTIKQALEKLESVKKGRSNCVKKTSTAQKVLCIWLWPYPRKGQTLGLGPTSPCHLAEVRRIFSSAESSQRLNVFERLWIKNPFTPAFAAVTRNKLQSFHPLPQKWPRNWEIWLNLSSSHNF